MTNIEKIIYVFDKKEVDVNLIANLEAYIKKVAESYNIELCDKELEVLVNHFNGKKTYKFEYDKENDKIIANEYYSYNGYTKEALDKYMWLLKNDPNYQGFVF